MSHPSKEAKKMSIKTTIAKRREAYQAISLMSRANAFIIYTRQNARGKIKRGDSFQKWLNRCIERTVADWATPSDHVGV